jgi:translation initiation factor IF-1
MSGATHTKKHVKNTGKSGKFSKSNQTVPEPSETCVRGTIIKTFGNGQFEVQCQNKEILTAKITRSWSQGPNKERLIIGDIVLVDIPPDIRNMKFIIYKYDKKEAAKIEYIKPLNTSAYTGIDDEVSADLDNCTGEGIVEEEEFDFDDI